MNLHRLLQQRLAAGRPVRVGLIGAGKFGSMFLAQAPRTAVRLRNDRTGRRKTGTPWLRSSLARIP